MRTALILLATSIIVTAVEVEAPRSASKATVRPVPATGASIAALFAAEEQWQFEPRPNRIDPFYDREMVLRLEKKIQSRPKAEDPNAVNVAAINQDTLRAEVLAWATQERERIESLVVNRKFQDAVKVGDAALKRLERHADVPDIQQIAVRIRTYRDQADEALIRNEAQSAFDGLNLTISGILWSQDGSRLVLLAGETKALAVNDRIKDCVIVNIDTDRVDFRFHHKRKRFEFPRYVGETTSALKP